MSYRHILYMNPDDLATLNKSAAMRAAQRHAAMAYIRTNELQEAQKQLAYVLKKDADNFDALDEYGVLLFKAGKYGDALKYFRKAASINDKDVMVYVHMSVAYDKLKEQDKARAALKKAESLASPDEGAKIEAERRFMYGR